MKTLDEWTTAVIRGNYSKYQRNRYKSGGKQLHDELKCSKAGSLIGFHEIAENRGQIKSTKQVP